MSAAGPNASPPWWNQTRAALARMFGPVQVRQLGLDAPGLANVTRASEATAWPAPGAGARENDWSPGAQMQAWQPLAAPAGGGNLDAAFLPCVVSGSIVPCLPPERVHAEIVRVRMPETQARDIGAGTFGAAVVLPLAVSLPGGQAFGLPIALSAPTGHAVSVAPTGGEAAAAKRGGRGGVPAFRAPQMASSLARITRVPLLRRRAVLPANADIEECFAAERRALASACGATESEVKLLASFPHIPLVLVQQMAVTPDGEALRLWLRPEALASGAGWTAARVSIVLGRRRSTGETIRAVLPEARTAGRKQ